MIHPIKIPVLDDGFVRYIDHMGDDHAIVQAARTSFIGTREDMDTSKDERLIRYLMRHKHMTPFEMVILKIGIRIPMDAWRQFIRHRLLSVNEYSTRYAPAINACQKVSTWRKQSENNKQGSSGIIDPEISRKLTGAEGFVQEAARLVYDGRLRAGVAKEQARKDLPLSTYTEAVVECDLRGWLHFLGLRLHPHAQQEIREYAKAIASIVKEHWPITYKAFEDYELNAMTLTACDLMAIKNPDYEFPSKREKDEFEIKRRKL